MVSCDGVDDHDLTKLTVKPVCRSRFVTRDGQSASRPARLRGRRAVRSSMEETAAHSWVSQVR